MNAGAPATGSFRRLLALCRKETLQMLRDPSSIIIAFVLPVVLLFIFGYGINLDTSALRVGLVHVYGGRWPRDAPTPWDYWIGVADRLGLATEAATGHGNAAIAARSSGPSLDTGNETTAMFACPSPSTASV